MDSVCAADKSAGKKKFPLKVASARAVLASNHPRVAATAPSVPTTKISSTARAAAKNICAPARMTAVGSRLFLAPFSRALASPRARAETSRRRRRARPSTLARG